MAKILAFAGSTRTESFNKKLIRAAVKMAEAIGAEVTLVDLRDFPMPLYDGDIEEAQGLPPHAQGLKKLMMEHSSFLIACPEYNSSITGVLKNAIDWTSRPPEKTLSAYHRKIIGLMSASPGELGGLRGLVHVRSILGNMGALVLPQQVAVGKAHEAFDDNGHLKNPRHQSSLQEMIQSLITLEEALTNSSYLKSTKA